MNKRVLAGSTAELDATGFLLVELDRREIVILREEGAYYAIDNECSHMGSQLQRGRVENGRIICPWHRAEFELATGKSASLYAKDIKSYPVELEGEKIFLVVDQSSAR